MLSEEMNLQIEMAGTDRACMMLVCINGCENNMPYGIIVNYHLPCPVSFGGIHGLILALDEVCEMVGAPMATTEPRFLQKERELQYRALRGNQQSPGKRGSGREAVSLCNSCEGGHSGPCVVQAEFLYAGAAPVQLYRNALYCFSQRAGADANVGGGKYLYVPKMVKSGFKDVKNKEYRRQPWYQPWLLLGLPERE